MVEIPNYYHPGSTLPLQLATSIASATIMRSFTPFTMSQVLLVRLHDNGPTRIVKVYDPRFAKHRLAYKSRTAHPWSHELEAKAISRTTPDPNFDFSLIPVDNDRVGWEIWYYQQMERRFRNEVESYNRLHSLQGHKIPRCYGSGTLILPNRAFFPRILLLQYISDAISLEDIAVKPNQSVITSLAETAYTFGALGVTHNDLNPGNILFSPRTAPTHAVIIDFGEAYFREDESDEEWDEIVKENWDVHAIKQILVRKGWELRAIYNRSYENVFPRLSMLYSPVLAAPFRIPSAG
jgi:tRNA A-37 threonylcarbamoyl transferase component Bud32